MKKRKNKREKAGIFSKENFPKSYGILVMFLLLIYTFQLFWIGFHNLDICHNEKMISLYHDIHIAETKVDGSVWSLDVCYMTGLQQIRRGFITSMIVSLMLGYLIRDIQR